VTEAAPAVPAPGGFAAYWTLLRLPQAARLLTAALLGRAQFGMASLAILLLVHGETGSFADAGVAVGVFGGFGAVLMPVLGRVVDRVGQVPVLAACGAAQSAGFLALALAARHGASLGLLIALAAVTGACLPPVASSMRALWPVLTPDPTLREAAYTLDAISQELIWTVGPLTVGVLVAVASASLALVVCAALTAFGITLYVTSPVPRSVRPAHRHPSWIGALASRQIQALVGCLAIGWIGMGICQVGIPAIAVRAGSPASAGVLLAMWAVGSLIGGIGFGAIQWRSSIATRYAVLYVLLAVLCVPLVFARSIPVAIVCVLCAGLPLAPLIGCQYSLVSAAAPAGTATEAFAWTAAAAFGAASAGSAIGGWLIKQNGLTWAFAAALVPMAAAAVLAIASVGGLRAGARIQPPAATS